MDLKIEILIPMNSEPDVATFLQELGSILEDCLNEVRDGSHTIADELGFGGNVLFLTANEFSHEICL